MKSLVKIFTQAAKDTVNGFSFKSPMGIFHAGVTGLNAYHLGAAAYAVGFSSSMIFSGVFLAAGMYYAYQDGARRRENGLPARYIP